MARRFEDTLRRSESQLPRTIVTVLGFVIAVSGGWLWWFGEDLSRRATLARDVNDPATIQRWMETIHTISAWALGVVIVALIVRAVLTRHNWQVLFLSAGLLFLAVGISAGITADWNEARLWSENAGSKLRAGLDLTGGPALPSDLQGVRVHLSIVPAALLAVTVMSFLRPQR